MQQGDSVPKPRIESGRVLRTRVPAPAPLTPPAVAAAARAGRPLPVADPPTHRWGTSRRSSWWCRTPSGSACSRRWRACSTRWRACARRRGSRAEIAATPARRRRRGGRRRAKRRRRRAARAASPRPGGPVRDASFKLNDENIQVPPSSSRRRRRPRRRGEGTGRRRAARRHAGAKVDARRRPLEREAPPVHRTRHFCVHILRPGVMCERTRARARSVPRVAWFC